MAARDAGRTNSPVRYCPVHLRVHPALHNRVRVSNAMARQTPGTLKPAFGPVPIPGPELGAQNRARKWASESQRPAGVRARRKKPRFAGRSASRRTR
jgi:hypothetical protein